MGTVPRQILIRWYFTLSFFEGLAILIWLFLAKTGSSSWALTGFSIGHLAILTPCLIIVGMLFWCTIILWRHPIRAERWSEIISGLVCRERFYWGTIALCGMLLIAGIYAQAIAAGTIDGYMLTYHVRLSPYAWWGIIISIQTPVAMRLLRFGRSLKVFLPYRPTFIASLIALCILLLLSAWIVLSGVGLKPDAFGWGSPGVPLLPSQITQALLILIASVFLAGLIAHLWQRRREKTPRPMPGRSIDILIFLVLWLLATWRWGAEPLQPNYFVPNPMPPNFEYYPYSDASAYDLSAQSLLLGQGFESDVIRPIY